MERETNHTRKAYQAVQGVSKSLEMALEELNLVALVGMPWMGDKGQSISVLSAGGGQPIVSISIILI